ADPPGDVPPPHEPRRAAAALERLEGRHVARGPEARAAGVPRRAEAGAPRLHAPADREGGHDGPRAGARAPRRLVARGPPRRRPRVRAPLVAPARPRDPRAHARPRLRARERVLIAHGARGKNEL